MKKKEMKKYYIKMFCCRICEEETDGMFYGLPDGSRMCLDCGRDKVKNSMSD